jgi:hypothetical protein
MELVFQEPGVVGRCFLRTVTDGGPTVVQEGQLTTGRKIIGKGNDQSGVLPEYAVVWAWNT